MSDIIPPKPKRRRAAIKTADAIALPHLVDKANWFDENGMPHPYVWVGVISFHLIFLYFLISIEPIIINKDPILGVEIIQLPKEEPIQEIKKPIIEEKIPPVPQIKREIIEPKKFEAQKLITQEAKPIEEIAPKITLKQLKIQAQKQEIIKAQIQDRIEKIETKIEIPEQIEDFKLEEVKPKEIQINRDSLKIIDQKSKISNQKIDTKINIPQQIEDFEIENINPKDVKIINPNPNIVAKQNTKTLQKIDTKINIPIDAPPNPNSDNKKLDEEKQKELSKLLEQQKQNNNKLKADNPAAKDGELSKPSGITALNNGGGAPPVGGGGGGGGGQNLPNSGDGVILPKKPASFGKKGGNIFEGENENGSLISRVGQSLDCAKLGQKERSEKCPNWEPLEGTIRTKIPPKAPIGFKPPSGPQSPLKPCPPNSPHSNLGVKCIGAPLQKNQ